MKNKIFIFAVALFVVVIMAAACSEKNPTKDKEGPAYTFTVTGTITQTATITRTHTVTPTKTVTYTITVTYTVTETNTATVTPTNTPKHVVLLAGSTAGSYDTYMKYTSSGNNYGDCSYIEIGGNTTGTDPARGLVRFGVAGYFSAVPTVVAVSLRLYCDRAPSGSGTIYAHKLTESFVEGQFCDAASTTTACWSRRDSGVWTNSGGTYGGTITGSAAFNSSMSNMSSIYITLPLSIVEEWYNNDSTNYGLLLKLPDEFTTPGDVKVWLHADGPASGVNPGLDITGYW